MSSTPANPNTTEEKSFIAMTENCETSALTNGVHIEITPGKKDNSMEELRVDVENENNDDITVEENQPKETSAENDFLGNQSLRYSGSESNDEDEINRSPKGLKRIIDSEDEIKIKQPNFHKTKKVSTINDSDSEAEKIVYSSEPTKNFRRTFNRLGDSESEDAESEKQSETVSQKDNDVDKEHGNAFGNLKDNLKEIVKKSKISLLIDSDSESDSQMSPNKVINSLQNSKSSNRWKDKIKEKEVKHKSKLISPYDFESESDSQLNSNRLSNSLQDANNGKKLKHKIKNKSKLTSPDFGSDSSSSMDQTECFSQNSNDEESLRPIQETDGSIDKKQKPMRASAKKALDEMQAIQSEQQRLHREAHISIPYHKPKRHTLQEFLKRHTNIKPQQEGVVSPLSKAVKSKSLKMNTEELEEYAKLMEERAKEATEFFKSESEDEELRGNNRINEKLWDNNEIDEKEAQNDSEVDENNTITTDITAQPEIIIQSTKYINSESAENVALPDEPFIEENLEPTAATSLIVTEVIELPKIDINSLHLTPTSLITPENIQRIIHEKNLPDSPSLQGDKNMLIDLETGDLVAKEPSGLDNLLKRFLAAKAGRKPKTTETLSILSTENGKIEMSKVNINITDELETVDQKPGEAYFKLKENLRSIIMKKRREDLEKKKIEKVEEELEHNKCLDDYNEDEEEEEEYEDYSSDIKSNNFKNKYLDVIDIDEDENAVNIYEDEVVEADGDDSDNESEESNDGEESNAENSVPKTTIMDKKSLKAEGNNGENSNDIGDYSEQDENKNIKDDNFDHDIYNEDQESDSDSNDDNDEQSVDNLKRKNRIIKGFQDDSDEEIDLLKTPSTQAIMSLTSGKLFSKDYIRNQSCEENELLGLCSGKFNETQKTQNPAFISQIPITQANIGADAAHDELLELCSGTFEENKTENSTQAIAAHTSSAPMCNKIVSSEEENSINVGNTDEMKDRIKKLTKRMKKKNTKLGFSDDEDEEITQLSNEESLDGSGANVDEEEAPETFIDYDSEENEIVVQMTKKDCFKHAENFFEKEAELSESEWGSADEDEKNLDKYDIELGDEDEFDREKIRAELGQIHARKMLDADIREVRKIQEMFFEDEEKDGVGRQRQFRWKNAENGFSLENPNGTDNVDGENAESGDDENEHLWRKIRYEREQLLKEQVLKENSQEISSTTATDSTVSAILAGNILTNTGITKKLNIITARKTTSVEIKKSSPFLISKSVAVTNKKTVRGSFLVRDKETLSKLAGLTKGGINDANGTAGTVSVKDVKPQNFVFATLTEEEHTNLKRKSDDVLNSSNENGINFMKKVKTETRREKCFIDQLL